LHCTAHNSHPLKSICGKNKAKLKMDLNNSGCYHPDVGGFTG